MVLDCDTWPEPLAGCYGGCDLPAGVDPLLLTQASEQAGVVLRTLSGGRVGTCLDTLRPLGECPTCVGLCTCAGAGDRIRLTSAVGPVTSVTGVTVDGTPVPVSDWRYYPSGQTLYRVPPGMWPTFDRKWADCGDVDTFCVDVVIGHAPDVWALAVHAELTCELVKACTGDKGCRIPSNATQVSAQGITVTLDAASSFIPSVKGWVEAINPDKAQSVSKLYSPDLQQPRQSGHTGLWFSGSCDGC